MCRQIFRQMEQKAEWILAVFTSIFVKYDGKFASRWRAKSPDALCAVLPYVDFVVMVFWWNWHFFNNISAVSALDPELTGEILEVIRLLAEDHMTMVIVTHEMSFARAISNRIIFMADGYIVEEGTPEQIFERPAQERTRQFLAHYQ